MLKTWKRMLLLSRGEGGAGRVAASGGDPVGLSGAVVGARGDRAEREGGDDDQGGGEGAPAIGRDGLHRGR